MIAFRVFLKPSNQIIHQALGRSFHPPPGSIAIGEIITPLVVGFPGDLAFPQRVGRCLPFVQHPVQLSRLLAVPKIHPQANITPIDYDPGATRVNQENRIKLMLAVARERLMDRTAPPPTVEESLLARQEKTGGFQRARASA